MRFTLPFDTSKIIKGYFSLIGGGRSVILVWPFEKILDLTIIGPTKTLII